MTRHYSLIDHMIIEFNRTLQGSKAFTALHASPAQDTPEQELTEAERAHAAGLMRVNHVGEICAQALYRSQAWVATDPQVKTAMLQSAKEEGDHLYWCEQRLKELESHPSYLNPFWYAGAFAMGTLVGKMGDKISLGFIRETEYQVSEHLASHLKELPFADQKSRKIVKQMREDELHHATQAEAAGAEEFAPWAKWAMKLSAKVMTTVAYWV